MSNKIPKISVLIPVYNDAELLPRALESVPKDKDVEVLILSDGSTDDSFAIADRWRTRNKDEFNAVRVIYSQENKGVAAAMNSLFSLASGEYIVSLSSDDYYLTSFEPFKPLLNGKNDLVFFDLEVNDGTLWQVRKDNIDIFVGAVKFIRRKFLGNTRIPNLKWEEDVPFSQALYKKKPKMVFSGVVLKHYNWPREGSLTWQRNNQ